MKRATIEYVNHTLIHSWNQSSTSNEASVVLKVNMSLMGVVCVCVGGGLELTTDY